MPMLFLLLYLLSGSFLIHLGLDAVVSTVFVDVVVSILIFMYLKKSDLLLKNSLYTSPSMWVCYVLLFSALWLFGQITSGYIQSFVVDSNFTSYTATMDSNPVLAAFLTLFFAPIAEEFLMRGLFYGSLRRVLPSWVALFTQAVIFSILHGTVTHLWICFSFGLFLGVIYERTGSIKTCILFHFMFNGAAVIFGGLTLLDFMWQPFVWLTADILLFVSLCFLYYDVLQAKKRYLQQGGD